MQPHCSQGLAALGTGVRVNGVRDLPELPKVDGQGDGGSGEQEVPDESGG